MLLPTKLGSYSTPFMRAAMLSRGIPPLRGSKHTTMAPYALRESSSAAGDKKEPP